MSVRVIGRVATVAVLAAALTSCFENGPVTAPSGIARPSGTTVTTTTPPPTTGASTTAATTTTTSPVRSSTRTSVAPGSTMLTDLRTGARDGADRVVLEFTGPVPPYRIARQAGPVVDCGSGAERGGAGEYLVLTAEPVGIFDHDGYSPYTGPRTVAAPGRAVSRALITCHFEGQLQVAIELTRAGRGYTDSTLTGPGRIVIDVAR